MGTLSDIEMERIRKEVEKEFPTDSALQQVHMARKILTMEAAKKGLNFFDYIRSLDKPPRNA